MSLPTLDARLRQHSRRSNYAVGITMALTMALVIGGFALLFVRLDPVFQDFAGAGEPKSVVDAVSVAPTLVDSAVDKPTPTKPAKKPTRTPTSTAFNATLLSNPTARVQLRPEPDPNSGPAIVILNPSTPLEFLGDTATDSGGLLWLKVETKDGQIGWVRKISTVDAA